MSGTVDSLGVEICRKARGCSTIQLLLKPGVYLHKLVVHQVESDDCHNEAPPELGDVKAGRHWPWDTVDATREKHWDGHLIESDCHAEK